jgi:hypothetical protein
MSNKSKEQKKDYQSDRAKSRKEKRELEKSKSQTHCENLEFESNLNLLMQPLMLL